MAPNPRDVASARRRGSAFLALVLAATCLVPSSRAQGPDEGPPPPAPVPLVPAQAKILQAISKALSIKPPIPGWTDKAPMCAPPPGGFPDTALRIFCDPAGKIVMLDLQDYKLSGPIPTEISAITSLQQLFLSTNNFTGSIPPSFSQLTNLSVLAAAGNKLSGDVALSISDGLIKKLPHLAALDISSNGFTGSIPPSLSSLTALTQLWLAHNQLSGPIPDSLGKLLQLRSLMLNGNKLNGSIPATLGALTNLRDLELNDTSLSGVIPPTLGNLSQLAQWGADNTGLQCPGNGSSCGGVKQHASTTFCLDICPSFCTTCTPADLAAAPLVLQQPAPTGATPANKTSTRVSPALASAAWAVLAAVLPVALV
ncbi:hypothetical protein CLOM_g9025 [Closterium sp. NIES-68]|nr:hypothetical protein CLOM_g9025 [Closterium sp. NIES-68]GJP66665.1 hypothetical protein CLOP_g23575 [Closterium sp. NIES-67]